MSATTYLAGLIAASLALHAPIVVICAIASAGFAFLAYYAWLERFPATAGGLTVISNALALGAGVGLAIDVALGLI